MKNMQTYGKKPLYLQIVNLLTPRRGWISVKPYVSLRGVDTSAEEM